MTIRTAAIHFITLFGFCFSTLFRRYFLVVDELTCSNITSVSIGQLDVHYNSTNFRLCRPFNIPVNHCLLTNAGFQTTVIHILAKIRSDMKNLTDRINDMCASVRSLVDGELEDTDLELPDGLILPMSSMAHMDLMAASLDDATFRKRVVR